MASLSGMSATDDDCIKVSAWQRRSQLRLLQLLQQVSQLFSLLMNRMTDDEPHFQNSGGKIFYKMLHLLLLLSASSMAKASYGPALGLGPDIGPRYGYSSGYQQQHT